VVFGGGVEVSRGDSFFVDPRFVFPSVDEFTALLAPFFYQAPTTVRDFPLAPLDRLPAANSRRLVFCSAFRLVSYEFLDFLTV